MKKLNRRELREMISEALGPGKLCEVIGSETYSVSELQPGDRVKVYDDHSLRRGTVIDASKRGIKVRYDTMYEEEFIMDWISKMTDENVTIVRVN